MRQHTGRQILPSPNRTDNPLPTTLSDLVPISPAQVAEQIAEDVGPEALIQELRQEGWSQRAIQLALKKLFAEPNWLSLSCDLSE